MSWNFNIVGKPQDVKAAVKAMDYVPQPIKDMVAHIADAKATDTSANAMLMQVQSTGHYSPTDPWSSVMKFEVGSVQEAPAAVPLQAAEAPQPAGNTGGSPGNDSNKAPATT